MSGKKIAAYLSTAAVALVLGAMTVQAAEIKRVRCRVDTNPPRVQISVDARNFDRDGVADGVTRQVTIGIGGDSEMIDGVVFNGGDVKVEWDSDIDVNDPAEGERETIGADFVGKGNT